MERRKRFQVKEEHFLGVGTIQIVVDSKTGVNYIVTAGMTNNGITPLLDKKGKVVIDKLESDKVQVKQ